MTRKELFEKNLELSNEFSRYILEHPEIAKRIPNEAIIVILPEYDRELADENLRIAKANKEKDQPIILIKVKKLAPVRKSRLIEPELELVSA
ncbi:MAG: hypothetical protein K8R68_04910 [Bacteroidales bacterium]|nr:hypothetical protein [Bacteroidales bacterium]